MSNGSHCPESSQPEPEGVTTEEQEELMGTVPQRALCVCVCARVCVKSYSFPHVAWFDLTFAASVEVQSHRISARAITRRTKSSTHEVTK